LTHDKDKEYNVGDLVRNLKFDSIRFNELGIIVEIIQPTKRKYYKVLQKKDEDWLYANEMEKL